ncbi:MAG: hypothetical protein ACRCV9_09555 [Burkholderiaceae bacterium]
MTMRENDLSRAIATVQIMRNALVKLTAATQRGLEQDAAHAANDYLLHLHFLERLHKTLFDAPDNKPLFDGWLVEVMNKQEQWAPLYIAQQSMRIDQSAPTVIPSYLVADWLAGQAVEHFAGNRVRVVAANKTPCLL